MFRQETKRRWTLVGKKTRGKWKWWRRIIGATGWILSREDQSVGWRWLHPAPPPATAHRDRRKNTARVHIQRRKEEADDEIATVTNAKCMTVSDAEAQSKLAIVASTPTHHPFWRAAAPLTLIPSLLCPSSSYCYLWSELHLPSFLGADEIVKGTLDPNKTIDGSFNRRGVASATTRRNVIHFKIRISQRQWRNGRP